MTTHAFRSGYAPLPQPSPVDPRRTRVSFKPTDGSPELLLLENGEPVEFSEERASEILQAEDLEVVVDLGGEGGGEAKYWTCDFSHVSRVILGPLAGFQQIGRLASQH